MKTTKETQIRVRMTHDDLDAFRAFAAKEGTTMASLIRQAIAEMQVQSPVSEWE